MTTCQSAEQHETSSRMWYYILWMCTVQTKCRPTYTNIALLKNNKNTFHPGCCDAAVYCRVVSNNTLETFSFLFCFCVCRQLHIHTVTSGSGQVLFLVFGQQEDQKENLLVRSWSCNHIQDQDQPQSCPNNQHPLNPEFNLSHKGCTTHIYKSQIINQSHVQASFSF